MKYDFSNSFTRNIGCYIRFCKIVLAFICFLRRIRFDNSIENEKQSTTLSFEMSCNYFLAFNCYCNYCLQAERERMVLDIQVKLQVYILLVCDLKDSTLQGFELN